jgi:putative redox protein
MYAKTKGWELGGVEAEVDYDPHATPRTCAIVVRTGRPVDASRLSRIAKVAATCPVRRALEGSVVFTERVEPATAGRAVLRAVQAASQMSTLLR